MYWDVIKVMPKWELTLWVIFADGTNGYVSGSKKLTFQYDPKKGKEILVYMNGCFGSTAWDISIRCPQ